tara:strand:+ start:2124 stop:2648 length:525 start_codon:yes stop_codon:yes gene_type:complete
MAFDFHFKKSKKIDGVWIVTPTIGRDKRGIIWSSFIKEEFDKILPAGVFFKHDKFSESKKNVLRGIHCDSKSWKLVTCVYGAIQQVVVDLRKESNTYNSYESFNIDSKSQKSILIPPNIGNAFLVLSNSATYHYKLAYQGIYFDADKQLSYKWNDPMFDIKWFSSNPVLSERDS